MENKILITNKKQICRIHKAEHEPFEYNKYKVTNRNEFSQCYVAIYDIPPLKSNYPYHYHTANTEVFYIISGNGILKTPDGDKKIVTGDVIVCPPTKDSAHLITNISGVETLTYIDFDTTNFPDIVNYPHSDKIGVIIDNQPSTFFNNDSKVNYYDGE